MDMDDMDIEQVYVVPDTPDRVASRNVSNKDCIEVIDSSGSTHARSDIFGGGPPNQTRGKSKLIIGNGLSKRLSFEPVKGPSIFNKYKADDSFTLPSTTSPSKYAHLFGRTMMCGTTNHGNRYAQHSQHKEKGIAISQSSPSRGNAVVDLTKHSAPAKASEMAVSDEIRSSMGVPNAYKGKEKIDGNTSRGSSGVNHIKEFAIPPPRVHGQKRLVRNGCISPHNIAKAKHFAENHNSGSVIAQNDVKSHESKSSRDSVSIRELISEDRNSNRIRGFKSNLSLSKEADTKNMPDRGFITHCDEATGTSTSIRDALRSFDGIGGWRNTHSLTKKVIFPSSAEDKHVNQQNERRVMRRVNRNGSSTSLSTSNIGHEQGSGSSNHGESSSFPSVDSDLVVLSPDDASNVRPRRNNHRRTFGSIIEIDEHSPDMRRSDPGSNGCSSSSSSADSYAKARQLEADEMLALELQEQLYNEAPQVRDREIDAHIALALQQEETSHQAFASESLPVFNPRGRSVSNSYRGAQARLSRNASTRAGTQSRGPTTSRLARLRGRIPSRSPRLPTGRQRPIFPSNMDLDMRMYILEALEAASDMGMASNVFHADRDFNENDYEMLLGLDDNNHQHGGTSVHVINGLPQSTVQNDNAEDCAICLETPVNGDAMRHLPCLHKFHKDCIDPWLRRKTSCPVCKSSVTVT